MPKMTISLLGTFSVTLDKKPVTGFTYDKVRALLAYLAVEADRPHHREHLADLLWPGFPERSARQNLSHTLSILRNATGDRETEPPFFLISTRELQFNAACDYELDVAAFTEHLRAAQTLKDNNAEATTGVIKRMQQAAGLYRGDFLEDLMIADSIPFEEWALLQRERLRRQALDVFAQLAENALHHGEPESALHYAARQLTLDTWRESAHRQQMRALLLSGQRNAAIAHYDDLRRILAADLGVEPEAATVELAEMLKSDAITTPTLHLVGTGNYDLPPEPGDPPFMGLQPFDVTDADRFFGREALTAHLIQQLITGGKTTAGGASTAGGFLAIVGASGSGKSSLARAGLIAAIRRGAIPGSQNWPTHLTTPTAHPLEALALILTRDNESVTAAATLMDDMAQDARSLRLFLRRRDIACNVSTTPTLLVVDQFEELFTLCRDPNERTAFIDNLLTAATPSSPPPLGKDPGGGIFVAITLRADFYDHCSTYPNLRDALSRHQVYIGPMTPDSLRHAIEEPAKRADWVFEPGLVDLLLRDVGADGARPPEPGALPLLSHALLETWKRRRGRVLTLGGYAEAGSVRGAIAKTADAVYAQLTPDQQILARNLFLRLTELGSGTQDTRRRVTRAEILSDTQTAPTVEAVLNTLAAARLITLEQDTVQVAHEVLIREWPALRGWLEEDREGLRIHRHLTESALEWNHLSRDPGELYRGARLAQATEWADTHTDALNPQEHVFLEASKAEAARVEQEREAQRQRELEAAQRVAETEHRRAAERGRMLRWIGAVAALLLVATVVAGLLGNQARRTAQENARLADDNANIAATAVAVSELEARQRAAAEAARAAEETARVEADEQRAAAEAAQQEEAAQRAAAEIAQAEAISQTRLARVNVLTLLSDKFMTEQHDLALLLSAQARNLLDVPLTRSSLLTALEAKPSFAGYLHTDVGSSERMAISPDGKYLAVGGGDRTIQVWDLETRQPVGDLLTGHQHITIGALAFSPDGEHLASGSCGRVVDTGACVEGEIFVWNLRTGEVRAYPAVHNTIILQLAFDTSGQFLASRGSNRAVLWKTDTAQVAHILLDVPETQALSGFDFSSDGTTLATGVCEVEGEKYYDYCVQSDVILWDVASGTMKKRITGPARPVVSWAFSANGSLLASTGCEDIQLYPERNICAQGHVQIWDVASGQALTEPFPGHTDYANWPQFIRDDTQLVTVSLDKTIRVWDVATGQPVAPPTLDFAGSIMVAASTPDGALLATGNTQEPNIRLWDIDKLGQTDPLRTGEVFARPPAYLLSMALNSDETRLAAGSFTGQIYVWDTATRKMTVEPFGDHEGWVYSVAFSPDGRTLASASVDSTIRLWDTHTGESILPPLEGHTRTVKSVAFSPDGTLLASGGDDATMRLWDAHTGELLSVNPGMLITRSTSLGLWDVTFSPDGTLVAGAAAVPEKKAVLWDVRDPTAPRVVARLPNNAIGGATSVAFSPDGKILAVGAGLEGTVLLWDVETRQPIGAPIPAHQRTIWPVAFSPDGTLLASGGLDGAIRLIDAATGQLIGPPLITDSQSPLGQSESSVHSLIFPADGKTLLSSNAGGFIHRWDVDPESWQQQACWLAGRNLTQAEWERYLPEMPYEKTCAQWPAGE